MRYYVRRRNHRHRHHLGLGNPREAHGGAGLGHRRTRVEALPAELGVSLPVLLAVVHAWGLVAADTRFYGRRAAQWDVGKRDPLPAGVLQMSLVLFVVRFSATSATLLRAALAPAPGRRRPLPTEHNYTLCELHECELAPSFADTLGAPKKPSSSVNCDRSIVIDVQAEAHTRATGLPTGQLPVRTSQTTGGTAPTQARTISPRGPAGTH